MAQGRCTVKGELTTELEAELTDLGSSVWVEKDIYKVPKFVQRVPPSETTKFEKDALDKGVHLGISP